MAGIYLAKLVFCCAAAVTIIYLGDKYNEKNDNK